MDSFNLLRGLCVYIIEDPASNNISLSDMFDTFFKENAKSCRDMYRVQCLANITGFKAWYEIMHLMQSGLTA